MCCFSRPVEQVASTKIFARFVAPGEQALVYQMKVSMRRDLAMVLPLPVVPGSPDDAVRFVDLCEHPRFFKDLSKAFPTWMMATPAAFGVQASRGEARKLEVVEVGDFEASFVPSRADFSRLDARFRLPDEVFSNLPPDWGYAVFKLKSAGLLAALVPKLREVHPMAFVFPSREDRLFFPTLHVHDGEVHAEADFDHMLYAQGEVRSTDWMPSYARLGEEVGETEGLVDLDEPGYRLTLRGTHANEDVLLEVV